MLPSKFGVNWPSVQEEKQKIDFQDGRHGGHLGFTIGMILAIFDLQVTPMLPSKFRVNWPFGSGAEAKNRFSRRRPWQPSWISDRNNFSYFLSTGHPDASYQVSSQLAQGCRRSRLLKQLLTPHDKWQTGHWLRRRCLLKVFLFLDLTTILFSQAEPLVEYFCANRRGLQ